MRGLGGARRAGCDVSSITMDVEPRDAPGPVEGDALLTVRGSAWLILAARKVRSSKHTNRYRLETERLGGEELAEVVRASRGESDTIRVWSFRWYPRRSR